MENIQILQNAPEGALYFGIVSDTVNYPVYLDGLPGSNSHLWIQQEDDGRIWNKIESKTVIMGPFVSIRSIDDIRSLFSKDEEIAELKETVEDCRDTICHLRSKHDDHD